jgi:hypothetical protein
MSSRELLELLEGLPDSSTFKVAVERTFQVVEITAEGPHQDTLCQVPLGMRLMEITAGEHKGKLWAAPIGQRLSDVRPIPCQLVAEYVDWTYDQKLLARNVRELASMRADGQGYVPDFTGVTEPLKLILQEHQRSADQRMVNRFEGRIKAGLYGKEGR